jgi:hypothetical protein
VGLKLREPRWKRETDAYVGHQIKVGVLSLVPADLAVTATEMSQLAASEVFNQLAGVFWEAVNRNEQLNSHKEHFYSNGVIYTTAMDVFLICGFFGFCYSLVGFILQNVNAAYIALGLIIISIMSRALVIPQTRRDHMALSKEQLALLRREEGDSISERFRDIILTWRRNRLLH